MIIAPNSKLSGATLQNFNLPDPRSWIMIDLTVAFSSDLELVENVVRQAALQAAHEVSELVSEREPLVQFRGFKGNTMLLQVGLESKSLRDKNSVLDALTRALHNGLRTNQIAIS
jgi:small-conductance mechanosensitive channel